MNTAVQPLLSVRDLQIHFPTQDGSQTVKAVDGIGFDVLPGETFGVIGESGSGKTTLGRALVGLLPPTAGSILQGGVDPRTLGAAALRIHRRDYQIVFQDPHAALNPRQTVLTSVCEPLEIAGGLGRAERERRGLEALSRVGIAPEYAQRYPHMLSGGQKQRVNIARALTVRPKLIVCDEVVAALDVSIRGDVLNLFADLQREFGLTYVFITHDLSVVAHVSDRIAVTYLGRLMELGPTLDVGARPLHPYTEALMSADPHPLPSHLRTRRRIVLEGEIPSPIDPPSGCRFRTRCPAAQPRCAAEVPDWRELRPAHWVACHFSTADGPPRPNASPASQPHEDGPVPPDPSRRQPMTDARDPHDAALPTVGLSRRDLMALAGAMGMSGLAGSAFAQGAAPARGGVLKVSANANPSSLDPATGGAGSDHTFLWTIFDTLVEWDYETLKAKPGMAAFNFPDPRTLVLDIKPGIVFHDGTPMDAAAVKFNLDRGRTDARSNIKADLQNVAEVVVSGPLQVSIKLARPDTALPAILSDRAGMMVSPKAVQALGQEHDRKPVGAGPWKFVSWSANEKVVVTRADKYWRQDRGFVDGIEFSIIPELATGLRAVVAGQNDFAYQVPPRLMPLIDKAKNLSKVTGPTLYCLQLYFNTAKKGLDNLKVRQAINFALDRNGFVKASLAGVGEPAHMQLPKTHWAYDPTLVGLYPHNIDKAKALLAEAGYKDGIDLTVGSYTDQDSVRRSEIVGEQLRKAGIRLKYITGTIPEISGQFFGNEKKFDMLLSAWTGRPDPSMTYSLMYSKDAYFNAGRTDHGAKMAELLAESRVAERIEGRKLIFWQLQRLIMEQALVAPLAFQYELVAASTNVKGYKPNLLGKPKYEFISKA